MSRLKLIRIGLYRQAKAFHHESSGAQNRKPCIGMKRIELITEEVLNATGRIWAASHCRNQMQVKSGSANGLVIQRDRTSPRTGTHTNP
jgi:hypothetical protein